MNRYLIGQNNGFKPNLSFSFPIDPSKDGTVRGVAGLATFATFLTGCYCFYKKNWLGVSTCMFATSGLGAAYVYLDKTYRNEKEKDRQKDIATSKIRHGHRKNIVVEEIHAKPSIGSQIVPPIVVNQVAPSAYRKMPVLRGVLGTIMKGCPAGYEDASLLSLLSMFGALCFSRCRSMYLDDKMHGPNIQVLVEAESGAGKGKIKQLYDQVFERVIKSDACKLNEGVGEGVIIQTGGIGVSECKLIEIFKYNQEAHFYMFEPEINAVTEKIKKKQGLRYDHIRKAFDGDELHQVNKNIQGSFPVLLNYTFTGTPNAIEDFVPQKEVEGGTASRICWTTLPRTNMPVSFSLPMGDEMQEIQEQIEEWREHYCYTNDGNGDVVCPEHEIDLSYVNEALYNWIQNQCTLAERDNDTVRMNFKKRMAAIAFHCAIPIHMMYEGNKERVVELVLYIADFCMNRYIEKFAKTHKMIDSKYTNTSTPANVQHQIITNEMIDKMIELRNKGEVDEHGQNLWGYGRLAQKFGLFKDGKPDKDTVKNKITKRMNELNR